MRYIIEHRRGSWVVYDSKTGSKVPGGHFTREKAKEKADELNKNNP